MRKVAIHQPNYLPWPGYFLKILLCDKFVFLDHVQFSKGSYTNRTEIVVVGHKKWLTIPVIDSGHRERIDEKNVSDKLWHVDQCNKLFQWLRHLPYFDDLDPIFDLYRSLSSECLSEINISLILKVADVLGIRVDFSRSSERPWNFNKSKLIYEISSFYKADSYISGIGFNKYKKEFDWDDDIKLYSVDFADELRAHSVLQLQSIVFSIAQYGREQVRYELERVKNQIESVVQ